MLRRVSRQLTATSSRDDIAALGTPGEDDNVAIGDSLQFFVAVM